jgi:hypothetical protein
VKLAHLADLHLGFRQYERQTPRGGNQREADVAEAFRRAVDDLIAQRPDLIVLAGDIFHSVRPTNPAILFLFQQMQRLRADLPDAPIVMVAGEHDTPRSVETGTILRLYEALGVDVVSDQARRLSYPKLDCAVLAVPHQALMQAERPAMRPQRGTTINVLVLHGQMPGIGETRGTAEYGGAPLDLHDVAPAQWDYVALGHYHETQQLAANAWYAGTLEYLPPNPWGQLQDEEEKGRVGKGYLLVDLPGARVTVRPIAPQRRHVDLPGSTGRAHPKELDQRIAAAARRCQTADRRPGRPAPGVRCVATARELDHAAIRAPTSPALHFHLDLRRPEDPPRRRAGGPAGGRPLSRRCTISSSIVRSTPISIAPSSCAAVVEYVEQAGREEAR